MATKIEICNACSKEVVLDFYEALAQCVHCAEIFCDDCIDIDADCEDGHYVNDSACHGCQEVTA